MIGIIYPKGPSTQILGFKMGLATLKPYYLGTWTLEDRGLGFMDPGLEHPIGCGKLW